MSHTLDQSGDTNVQELNRFNKLYGLPQFVKDANFKTEICCDSRKTSLYADPREVRQFPVHTKAATYVSYMFFLENGRELSPKVRPSVEDRLNKAAEYWGIKNACQALQTKHAAVNTQSLPDSCYAIVWATANGNKDRRYPLDTTLNVKAAAAWYQNFQQQIREEYAYSDRATIASKILKRANDTGAALTAEERELLNRACGRGLCDPVKAASMIRQRARAARSDANETRLMDKLAEYVQTKSRVFLDPASMRQLADTLDQFDRRHNLVTKYSAMIPPPEDVLFEVTYEQADKFASDSCQTITGSVYTEEQFAKLSASDIRGLFGDDIAEQVCEGLRVSPSKMAELVATLPRPDAEMFDSLMAENGQQPVSKRASDRFGLSFAELKQMAINVQ